MKLSIIVRILIGIIGRLIFWGMLVLIVGLAVVITWQEGNYVLAILEIIFFPLTFFIFPLLSGQWYLLLIALVGYWLSTPIGGFGPVIHPVKYWKRRWEIKKLKKLFKMMMAISLSEYTDNNEKSQDVFT